MDAFTGAILATLLVSLRIAPTFAFAPPFTLMRAPFAVRLLLALGLSAWMVAANPAQTSGRLLNGANLISSALSELYLGIAFSVCLQLAFAAMLVAGRALDIQAGFGLAQVADPTLRSQMPLVGTLFAYAGAAVFFAAGGPADLLTIWSQSLERVPLGAFASLNMPELLSFIAAVFGLAIALAGFVQLTLFLIDLAIAFLSRTVPQMNVLVLGFQVKTLALLATLPFVFALSGSLFLRIVRLALQAASAMA